MHDFDLIDLPPTDLDGDAEPADGPGTTDADALLALLCILDAVRDDPDGCLVVWCGDPVARDAVLDERGAEVDDEADIELWHADAERGACPGPSATNDRARRQRRRSRR